MTAYYDIGVYIHSDIKDYIIGAYVLASGSEHTYRWVWGPTVKGGGSGGVHELRNISLEVVNECEYEWGSKMYMRLGVRLGVRLDVRLGVRLGLRLGVRLGVRLWIITYDTVTHAHEQIP